MERDHGKTSSPVLKIIQKLSFQKAKNNKKNIKMIDLELAPD